MWQVAAHASYCLELRLAAPLALRSRVKGLAPWALG